MPTIYENFKEGDLIYGLDVPRKRVTNFLTSLPNKVAKDVPLIVDDFNRYIIVRFIDNDLNNNDLFSSIETELLKDAHDIPINHEKFKTHYQEIKSPSYPKVGLLNHIFETNEKKLDEEQRRTRRACKARMLSQTSVIHFLLDSIDLQHTFSREYSLANKSHFKLADLKCAYDAYTAAELRFALKHHHEIKSSIKFYYKEQEVNIFTWLAQQTRENKEAVLLWMNTKINANKVHPDTLKTYNTSLNPHGCAAAAASSTFCVPAASSSETSMSHNEMPSPCHTKSLKVKRKSIPDGAASSQDEPVRKSARGLALDQTQTQSASSDASEHAMTTPPPSASSGRSMFDSHSYHFFTHAAQTQHTTEEDDAMTEQRRISSSNTHDTSLTTMPVVRHT